MIKKVICWLLMIIFIPLAIVGIGFLYARFVEPSFLDVNIVRVDAGLTAGKTIRVAAFGDTHVGNGVEADRIKTVVGRINDLKPDVVLFLGDLFDNYEQYKLDPEKITYELATLTGKKYAVFGNHDLGGKAKKAYEKVMADSGFTLLCNKNAVLAQKINLIGLDDMIFGKPNMKGLLRTGYFNLLMVHEPDYGLEDTGAALQISGHTHGGQVVIPLLWQQKLPAYGVEYIKGMYKKNDGGLIYVNRGIGMSLMKLRLFSPPEITVFDLY